MMREYNLIHIDIKHGKKKNGDLSNVNIGYGKS